MQKREESEMDYALLADAVGPRSGATQEWVYRVLREGIVSGELAGGTQLKQDEISAALNVSHIPVREALRQLEAQGLVTIHPNRGASVTQLSLDTLVNMMEIRAAISVSMLRSAVPVMTEADFDELSEIIEEQRRETDPTQHELLNYKFHDVFSRCAKNRVADVLMEILHANIDRYLRDAFYSDDASREFSINEHEKILTACRARDVEQAAALLQQHIMEAKHRIPEDAALLQKH